jgi:hypothetical protein
LVSPLLHAVVPLPLFSPISSLIFLVKVLVNGCHFYLRVLGLYSYRIFGVFPSLWMKKNLYSPLFFLWCLVGHKRGRNGVFIALFFLITQWPLFFSFLYNWSHTTYVFHIFLIWLLNYYIYLFCISFHHSSFFLGFYILIIIIKKKWLLTFRSHIYLCFYIFFIIKIIWKLD